MGMVMDIADPKADGEDKAMIITKFFHTFLEFENKVTILDFTINSNSNFFLL